ncbi:hypothetical protein CTAM01_12579 [Colletotrichum tamarilloi]|uniref:ARCA protein n=1 Tax=Colletotrichum tamarilloi TaxID=1209934 RepID=A0ABQ9QU83_9PEZI|nr:uncharacterized protein CTAM01_12579 [Colletotrichum tamarilloi]KAK1485364.1 hypothetical protein CTAM01_12579 [Colletotrichum tamarilloi]
MAPPQRRERIVPCVKCRAPISDTISQNGEANNQHDDQIHDQITVAAELLQSISQREHSNPSESIGTSRVPTHQSRLRTNQSPPRGETTPEDVPQIALEDAIDPNLAATPAASSTIETPYSGFSAPSPSVPRSIPDGWDRRTPDIGGSRLSVLSQQWQLPLGDNRGRSSSVSRSLGGELHLGLQEGCLIRCFIEHLAAAFDTTDRDRHYVTVVPQRAMHNPLLMNAICTASARFLTQIWSKKPPNQVIDFNGIPLPNLDKESAIHYHSKSISYLMDTSTDPANPCTDDALTAITILRYHEQVDTHLTGTDHETYINAVQAVFHAQQEETIGLFSIVYHPPRGLDIYAPTMPSLRHSATLIALRQEIWSVLLYRRPFRLPLYGTEDCSLFEPDSVADDFDWANRILVWCAYVVKFCFGANSEGTVETEDPKIRADQWKAIEAFQHNWDTHQPPHFKPLAYQERNPEMGEYFPTVWHANDCQVLALQHIELMRIVLAVHGAKNKRLGIGAQAANQVLEETLRESTRKICGLAISNRKDQPSMVTAGVGVSLCGEYFRDEGEQKAVVSFMDMLETMHAWPTSSVVDALRTAWSTHTKV